MTDTMSLPQVGTYELGVLIEDAWQGHGLGTFLVRAAVAQVQSEGGHALRTTVASDNDRMKAILFPLGVLPWAPSGPTLDFVVPCRASTTTHTESPRPAPLLGSSRPQAGSRSGDPVTSAAEPARHQEQGAEVRVLGMATELRSTSGQAQARHEEIQTSHVPESLRASPRWQRPDSDERRRDQSCGPMANCCSATGDISSTPPRGHEKR
ncbi:GNAT family N-acetyltransferase [Streptomyces sp. NPDC020362]|uniref:GNAT family N-acetyltransferase n=1 Tax=unclassified Streptomyces TaxID=2593676 RepID=UPI0033F07C6A